MLPEQILQSDVLDIIFENRNKSYGAYSLRKTYNQRLLFGIAFMFLVTLLLFVLQLMPGSKQTLSLPVNPFEDLQLTEVQIKPDVPKEVLKPKPVIPHVQQPPATDNNYYRIVKDNDVIKPLKTNDDLDKVVISNADAPGVLTAPGENIPLADGGNSGIIKEMPATPVSNLPLESADIMPQFPGGLKAFMEFMHKNIVQPDNLDEGQKIIVRAEFVVQADGSIDMTKILQGGRTDLDREVMRVIRKMPKWIPGIKNGKNVAVYFRLPVTFVTAE